MGTITELFTNVSLTALLLRAAIYSALAVLGGWGWSRLIDTIGALTRERSRELWRTIPPLRLTLASVAAWATLAPVYEESPSAAVGLLLVALVTVSIWGLHLMRDVIAGLTLAVSRPFTIGDQIATPDAMGRVLVIGATRVRLLTSGGELLVVPSSEAAGRGVRVADGGGALPVTVTLEPSSELRDVARITDQVILSVYADPTAPAVVEVLSPDRVRITATPSHADEAEALRTDLVLRLTRSLRR